LKEREPRYINIRNKLASRAEGSGLLTPRQAAALVQVGSPAGGRAAASSAGRSTAARRQTGVLRPGAASRRAQPAEDENFEEDMAEPATARAGSRANGSGTGTRAAASTPRRPPPRPRKGKGSKKGGRRR
jgi:hypothetical protein